MGGGLMQLLSKSNESLVLTGNPKKTFFKSTYSKHTNFGLQKFRLDFTGQRQLDLNKPTVFDFKVPRHADLLMDTYLVTTIPHIWSTLLPPISKAGNDQNIDDIWKPYEFKWIKNLGTNMIKNIRFLVGGQVIQEFTGDYLQMAVERDFDNCKKDLFNKMTGNTQELNDPANSFGRNNSYPNVWPNTSDEYNVLGPEPSIRGRKIYIPLNIWFTLSSKMAFPLVSLQYNEMHIEVTMRPIKELYVIRDISKFIKNYSANTTGSVGDYIQPEFTNNLHQFHRVLQPPPYNKGSDISKISSSDFYPIKRTDWNSDIHLIATYAFLGNDEMRIFASKPQSYLTKQIYQTMHYNVVNSQKVKLETTGLVCNFMWAFRRSDANLRNEWSNYTNWPYDKLPNNIYNPNDFAYVMNMDNITPQYDNVINTDDNIGLSQSIEIGNSLCEVNPSNNPIANDININTPGYETNHKITGNYSIGNQKDIMNTWGLQIDGKYRENVFDSGVFNYIEKYIRTTGGAKDGIYCYNFGLSTQPNCFQPSGAMNLTKFRTIEFEFTTYTPPADPGAQTLNVCDESGKFIGINKTFWEMFLYTYNLIVIEERYNILKFHSGNASLATTR